MAENNSSNHQATQYNAITGGVSNTLNNVAPSATSGVPLISQGAAAQPIFGTVVAAGGGTGRTTLTVNSVICGNATSTVGMTNTATDGQLLIGKTAAIPAFATVTSSDSSITFTPGANTLSMQVAGYSGFVVGPASATDNALCRFDNTTGKLIQNGVITEDDTGNLSIAAAVSGGNLSAIVSNTSNTASAQAFYQAQVAGGTAADAFVKLNISGGQNWTMGLDNSDSDAFALSSNATLGTTNVMRVATAGQINYPLQPIFFVHMQTTTASITGDGTVANVQFDTTRFDVGSNITLNSGGKTIFTAPVTGKYYFYAVLEPSGGSVVNIATQLRIITSADIVLAGQIGSFSVVTASGANPCNVTNSAILQMTAGDIANIAFYVSTNASKNVAVAGSGSTTTFKSFFTGHLLA